MPAATADQIKKLRELTAAGIMDCRKALEETGGDLDKAVSLLREKGIASAASKANRKAEEGTIMAYVHHGGKLGSLVELNSETDFVARNEEFVDLAKQVAMQIAAMSPKWVAKEDVPAEALEAQRAEIAKQAADVGKSAADDGYLKDRLEQWLSQVCLLEQPFIRDPAVTIGSLVAEKSGKFGERLRVKRFTIYKLGEGEESK